MTSKTKNTIGIALYVLAIAHIVYSFYLATSPTIWYDEIYSMLFAFRPAKELIAFTARDVHPPLYYLILRVFLLIANCFFPSIEAESIAKAVSIIPYILMMIYSISFIRKRWGLFSSGLFIFSLCFMPEIMQKTVEIRMYGWALLFVTGLGLHFSEILDFENKKSSLDVVNYIVIFVYSVAAIYTHYFAAMAVFWIYAGAILIIGLKYINNKNIDMTIAKVALKNISAIIAVGVIAVICYIPWISVVISQVSSVKGNYWISPLSIKAPYSSAMFIFRAGFPIQVVGTILAILLICALLFLFFKTCCMAKVGDGESTLIIYWLLILPLVALTGYALSLAIRPIFIDRYLEPSMGLLWLAVSILVGKALSADKAGCFAAYLILLVCCLNAVVDLFNFYSSEANIRKGGEEFNRMLASIDEDTIIVSNSDLMQSIVTYTLNTDRKVFSEGESYNQIADYKVYLYMSDIKTLISEMLPGFLFVEDGNEIKEFVDNGRNVLFMTYSSEREEVSNKLKQDLGLDSELCGTYFYDHYDIDLMIIK